VAQRSVVVGPVAAAIGHNINILPKPQPGCA
jgi:hypothetical protein